MRTTLILCVMAVSAHAAHPVLKRITPEALVRLQQADPMLRLTKPGAGKDMIARPKDQSIIKQSTILHDGKNWTLVPKGSVVFVPASMKSRVGARPSGELTAWLDFMTANRAWITTREVTMDQATGKDPLSPEHIRFWTSQNKVVIAVHQRGPISVLPPETPKTTPES